MGVDEVLRGGSLGSYWANGANRAIRAQKAN